MPKAYYVFERTFVFGAQTGMSERGCMAGTLRHLPFDKGSNGGTGALPE